MKNQGNFQPEQELGAIEAYDFNATQDGLP